MFAPRCLLLSVFLVGACSVGEVPPVGGDQTGTIDGGATATIGSEAGFTSMIAPILTAKGCPGCHSGATPPNFTSYSTLDAKYKSTPLTTNILLTHVADGALHNGVPYLSTTDKATITTWINAGGG